MSRDPAPPSVRALLVGGVGLTLGIPWLLPWDGEVVVRLNPAAPGPWDHALAFFDAHLPVVLLTVGVVLGGWLWLRAEDPAGRRAGLVLALAPFVANRLTGVIKDLVERPRPQHPDHGLVGLRVLAENTDVTSFPSGHVTTTAAFAIALLFVLPKVPGRNAVLLLVPAMMWDRVALGLHFPSDALAGAAVAAFTLAGFAALLRERDPALPRALRVPAIVAAALVLTWVWHVPATAYDPVAAERLPGFGLEPAPGRHLFEPFVGPALELAYAPEPRAFVLGSLPWLALAIGALLAFPRSAKASHRILSAALLLAYAGSVAILAARGRLPADRFVAGGPGIFLDPHVHAADPVDGAQDLSRALTSARDRGIEVIAIANHDAPPPTPHALPACEWSGYLHPAETFLHLVVLGGDGAIDAALRHPVAAGAGSEDVLERVTRCIEEVRSAGGLVVVAHYWRTLRKLQESGREALLPSPDALVQAGVDGFEVANARWEADDEARRLLGALDHLCARHGLLRLSASDGHGRLAGSPCITFLPGEFPDDPRHRRRAVLEHLRERRPAVPLVFRHGRGTAEPAPALAAPVMAWRYLTSLRGGARISWGCWILGAWLAAGLGRRVLGARQERKGRRRKPPPASRRPAPPSRERTGPRLGV